MIYLCVSPITIVLVLVLCVTVGMCIGGIIARALK